MNDNDIIKALEFCESLTCECTSWCPVFYNGTNSKSDCRGELHKNALDLINRLKAEIERLTLENKKITETNNALNYQIDAWSPAEAIKEFAKRLSEKAPHITEERFHILRYEIDNLVKEMTEAINNAENDPD